MIKLLGLYIWIKPFNNLPQVNITINLRYQQCTASMWFHVRTKNRVHTVHFVSHRVMPYIRKAMFLWGFHPTSQGSLSDFLFFSFLFKYQNTQFVLLRNHPAWEAECSISQRYITNRQELQRARYTREGIHDSTFQESNVNQRFHVAIYNLRNKV